MRQSSTDMVALVALHKATTPYSALKPPKPRIYQSRLSIITNPTHRDPNRTFPPQVLLSSQQCGMRCPLFFLPSPRANVHQQTHPKRPGLHPVTMLYFTPPFPRGAPAIMHPHPILTCPQVGSGSTAPSATPSLSRTLSASSSTSPSPARSARSASARTPRSSRTPTSTARTATTTTCSRPRPPSPR